jgi:hypothetical protein
MDSSDDISSIIQSFMETQIDGRTKHVLSVLVTQILKPRVVLSPARCDCFQVPKGVSVCVIFPPPRPQKSHHKVSPKRPLASPRTPRGEADASVLPFAMSASFRAEAWKDRQRIETPHWQLIRNQDARSQGQDSSNEDISDETYLKMHARCFNALRKENLQILNNLARKKKGSDIAKECEMQLSDVKQVEHVSAWYPPVFNYDTSWSASKPWKKPKKFIEMVLTAPIRSRALGSQCKTLKRTRELSGALASPKAENHVDPPDPNLDDLVANHQVAVLKLRYLHLRKQLALLRQRSLESSVSTPNVLSFVNSSLSDPPGKHCLATVRKTTRLNAGIRKKKLDEL